MRYNQFNQPIGDPVPNAAQHGQLPDIKKLSGAYCFLEKLNAEKHLDDLYKVYGPDSPLENWTYLSMEPVQSKSEVKELLIKREASADPYYLTIINKQTNEAVGTFALMRIDPVNRSIEVGWVVYSNQLKRTRIATEAQYLLAKYVFEELEYRRYEWKCDSLNQPSRNAALRLGFTYEGTFRNAVIYKDRSRDTAWFSILDTEWPEIKARFEAWLAEDNFDEAGNQRRSLDHKSKS
ncbi:acetyltransferase [Paenibacillus oryzae]|uniref:Acetyltransferase n=1 Tax=Paenibacillus oryzae TaxID=1844972 RepID=A0A1A5YDW1_9BACL|nr:GNAT family protein [Paenibacillus oryzae]OBR63769.1 acetyltransferase [Paenibacillus oryzae]